MRTTVTIDDHLLAEAKALAAHGHRTVGSVLEEALREMLARHEEAAAHQLPISLPTSGGGGLRAGVDLYNKEQMAELLGDNEPPR